MNADKVEDFHLAFGAPILEKPGFPSIERRLLREDLIYEEINELYDALEDENIVEVADALGDLLYVIYGTALEFGIPIDDVFAEIHRSNMSKLENGKPLLREDGKILKGSNYSPPNIQRILERALVKDG